MCASDEFYVGYINGVDFVSEERVSEVNALLVSPGFDIGMHGSGVHDYHDASDQLLLFQ